MKITPLEIRQKTFEKAFRGVDKEEVNAFLTTLSQQWEKMLDENRELRLKLESTTKEVQKMREAAEVREYGDRADAKPAAGFGSMADKLRDALRKGGS